MDAAMFRSLVEVESAHANGAAITREDTAPYYTLVEPAAPKKAVPRTYPAVPQRDVSIELERIPRCQINTTTTTTQKAGPSGTATPVDPSDLEKSRPATPIDIADGDGVDVVQSVWDPYMNRYRLLSVCLILFSIGLNDSALGALLPYIEQYYGIGYGIVSLIFVGNTFGFILAAVFLDTMRLKLGRARSLALAQATIACGFVPLVASAPFPAIVAGFFLIGYGVAINCALGNTFCGGLRNGTAVLGAMHGSYGIGGTVGPLIATTVVTHGGAGMWNRYYVITLALNAFNAVLSGWVFWGYECDPPPQQEQQTQVLVVDSPTISSGEEEVQNDTPVPGITRKSSGLTGMLKAFKSRTVMVGALFIFAYQGAEVSISGWVISFLITTRDGNPSSVGYVTAGFWGGITLGRFLLTQPAHRIGEKLFVYGVVVLAAVFELLVWLVPNVLGDAVAVSVVGLLLGPVYPCAAAVLMRSMSRREQASSIGVISAFGSSGGAAAPFTTGILAQAVGTFVLHPIAIGLFGVMLVCWYQVPNVRKRTD